MRWEKLVVLTLSIGVGFVAYTRQPTKTGPAENLAAGKELFHQHCSSCHGADAKGGGSMYDPNSMEASRRVRPPDLRTLSERNGGTFPADRVRDSIYSKGPIPAHGTPEMPAWGDVFYNWKSQPKAAEARVRDLTAWIESIQAAKK